MLYNIAAIIAGFLLLVWSADRFICGAAATARNLNISPLIIGLTIVGFGTSAPEMLVAAIAAMDESPGLAVGNALGSNITNITLVLGLSALIMPLDVHSRILKKELPLLLMAMLLMLLLIQDNILGRTDGLILTSSVILLMWWVTRQAMLNKSVDPMYREFADELPRPMSTPMALFWLVLGLVLLVASSRILVWGAVQIATEFGVSDLLIGLTIIAIGTSLPELAASIAGALKDEHDIAIGNVVGSNMFNTLAVMGIPGLIYPSTLDAGVLDRDVPVVFILTIALVIMVYGFRGQGRINRIEGGILLACFAGYQVLLYFTEL
ncbi:MAG: calcium/sodium antiporter [Gammaproteobacteria bacterium]|jgi:cation:H+ antiporter